MTTTTAPTQAPTATQARALAHYLPMAAEAVAPRRFTFYVDGCGIEVHAVAATRKEAHKLAWASLTDEQQNRTACLDCIDEQAVAPRRFATVYCSQCGAEFPGAMRDGGFSACREHATPETHAALFARLRGAL